MVGLVLLLILPTLLLAQSPPARLELSRFRDSIAAVSDTGGLRALARRLERSDGRMPDEVRELRRGFLALRLGELGADRDFGDALRIFGRCTERRPELPLCWHGLALAHEGRSDWELATPTNLGSRVGLGRLERAARAHARAVEADPEFEPAAVALADVVHRLRDTVYFSLARDALRRTARIERPSAELLVARGRVERLAGHADSAHTVFERYLVAGGNRALGLLELARTRLAKGRADGMEPYFEGAESDDSAVVAGYRADLAPIVSESVLAEFDTLRGEARAEWLRRFWSDRDQLELRAEGERLREHYRRLDFARRHFALTISRRYYGRLDAYRSGSLEFDDRGILYLRHGEPAERLRPFVFGLMPHETWRYRRADGDLLLHFSGGYDHRGGGDLYDYRLVESVLDLRGASDAPTDQLLLSRQSLSPVYGRMLHWGRFGAARMRARERSIGQASIAYGTRTDSYELQFARPLEVSASMVAVGRRDSLPLAHLVFAMREGGPAPTTPRGTEYPVRVRLVLVDARDRPVAALDTAFVLRPARPPSPKQFLIGRVELPVRDGRWVYRAAIQWNDSTGAVIPRDTVTPAPADGRALTLSDLALGTREAAARWVPAPGDTVLLTPFRLFRQGLDLELYYEAHGVLTGTRYRQEISVHRWNPGRPERSGKRVVTLGFVEEAAEPVLRARRTLRLADLPRGDYLVQVRVVAPDGSAVERRRGFTIVKGGEGG